METEGKHTPQGTVSEVALLTLRLGFTAFGGPAAHIAMLRDEVVTRRKWVTDDHFLDLLGATNLIPGPNSTEMVIHVGQVRAGWRGMIAAGVCFIMPAALIVLACAWAYVQFGTLPAAEWLLYGIKPVIIAIVVQALWGLAKTAVKGPFLAAVGVAVLALYLLGFNELALLFGGGILVMLLRNLARLRRGEGTAAALLPLGSLTPLVLAQAAPVSLGQLFWSFLKIGAVLYGSGYVLLPSCAMSSWCGSAGSPTSNCSTPLPSASSPPARSSPRRRSLVISLPALRGRLWRRSASFCRHSSSWRRSTRSSLSYGARRGWAASSMG